MKKILFYVFLSLIIVPLSSCSPKNTQVINDGSFEGIGIDEVTYYATIDSITFEVYKSSNGKNVLEDEITKEKDYYSIEFYKLDGDEKIIYDFYNLKYNYRTTQEPVIYKDDNGNSFLPSTSKKNATDEDVAADCYFHISYNEISVSFERRIK